MWRKIVQNWSSSSKKKRGFPDIAQAYRTIKLNNFFNKRYTLNLQ